ncbi:FUSC family protein [Streptomyces mirabilis]|uniref:FUSC family protein n=1 Tax=Streptomyces mirabilis TaxID=68239 RepID=UPI0036896FEC
MFAFGSYVIGNAVVASYAAFGAIAMLLPVDFTGPMRGRLRAQAVLGLAGAVLVCLGTLVSGVTWLAVLVMAAVAFFLLFVGAVSSVLASITTALLLAFIPPMVGGVPLSVLPDRLAGWGIATGVSVAAIGLLWPAHAREPLIGPAVTAIRALCQQVRRDVELLSDVGRSRATAEQAGRRTAVAVDRLRDIFIATPYRITGLTATARAMFGLVDELLWLDTIVKESVLPAVAGTLPRSAVDVRAAAATVLDEGAALLEARQGDLSPLRGAVVRLEATLAAMDDDATTLILRGGTATLQDARNETEAAGVFALLDPSFRSQAMAFSVWQIAWNIERAAAAEQRSMMGRLLGRERPNGIPNRFDVARKRAAAHAELHAVWLHNSVRGAAGLALAVAVADIASLQQSYWIVLGTLAVLRSNALNTGQNIARSLLGTALGSIVGGILVSVTVGQSELLWFVLPLAVLVAGLGPTISSFALGQAGFTLAVITLYTISRPVGWHLSLVRTEDIAIGCVVSIVVGIIFWPRGAEAAMGRAIADAYSTSADYLASAVEVAVGPSDGRENSRTAAAAARTFAAAARLDSAFRSYLAERGGKRVSLADKTTLLTGATHLRLVADAVVDLWERAVEPNEGNHAATLELVGSLRQVTVWYRDFASSLEDRGRAPEPLGHDEGFEERLVAALRQGLASERVRTARTAMRLIWTADHVNAARRLQDAVHSAAAGSSLAAPQASAPTA